MNKQQTRIVSAEVTLLAIMVEVAILGIVPEYRDVALVLFIPFLVYGLFHLFVLNQ